jgi:hypothetical protein
MIGTPAFGGQVTSLYATSMLAFQSYCLVKNEVDFNVTVQWGDSLITRARQDVVTRFLDTPQATHLLFVDGDIGFAPEQVFRLLQFDTDFVAGIYPYKKVEMGKIRALSLAGHPQLEAASLSYTCEVEDPTKVEIRSGFAKVRYAGLGFALIKRSVFLRMEERYPELNYTGGFITADPLTASKHRYAFFNCMIDEKTGTYLSEDHSFSRRWLDMGGEIWADLGSRLQHVGPINFHGNFATQFQNPNPAPPMG